ncbi:uncharacterized protein LOC129595317 [Paramacrobiotus metropolitanus]|uniref:uncharacterized protein LOC129595317 n=1 Tax=Paramacrobiotus metropolitanus TaxID=2943436 RepID=UPI0024460291|nr:uncharacterized protein LOC129595317 [Paramacrobiotus metropolitanus]
MQTFLSVAVLAGIVTLAYGAGVFESKMVEVKSVVVDCDQEILYTASESAKDCYNKCTEDGNCRMASYNIRDKQCGLVPPQFDCTFGTEVFNDYEVIGSTNKPFIQRDNASLDAGELKNQKGQRVLQGANGKKARISADKCKSLCDFHPNCKAAYYTAARGQAGTCQLMAKAEPIRQIIEPTSTSIVLVAQFWGGLPAPT